MLLHVLAAIVWVGGMVFLAVVVVPIARAMPAAERAPLLASMGRRFRVVGWLMIGVLITTGIVNAAYRGVTWDIVLSGQILQYRFGQILTAKVAAVLAMVVIEFIHDFMLGPASLRALEDSGGRQQEVARLSRQAAGLARLSGILALLVVALAISLVRGLPW